MRHSSHFIMNNILLSVFAAGLMFSVGHALQCYKCDLGLWNLCLTTTTTCNAGELCFSGLGKAASAIDIKTKGCLAQVDCNKTSTVSLPGSSNTTVYSMTKTCCASDLCNAASSLVHLSALPLVLLTLTSYLVTKVVV